MSPGKEFYTFNPEPLFIVISGLSASGKDTVIKRMRQREMPFHFVVTATTRPARPEEKHGEDYFFLTRDEFQGMIDREELLEYALVYKDYKGVPKAQVREAMVSGKDVVLRVDVQGAETLRKLVPEALMIFLTPQNEDELVRRLTKRKSEDPEELKLRISTAHEELKKIPIFDYVVVNRDHQLENTIDTIEAIIMAEHHRVRQRKVTL